MQPLKIIIAESHKLMRQLLTKALKEHHIEVIAEAVSASDLLNVLKHHTPHLVLINVAIDKSDNKGIFNHLSRLYPQQKLVVISPFIDLYIQSFFLNIGITAIVNRNMAIEELVEVLFSIQRTTSFTKSNYLVENNKQCSFTERELEIIALVCEGKTNKEIANALYVCEKTIEAHKNSLFKKTKTTNTHQCMAYLMQRGFNYLS
jgi:DNA-binding NarL/FixJ family response regulator